MDIKHPLKLPKGKKNYKKLKKQQKMKKVKKNYLPLNSNCLLLHLVFWVKIAFYLLLCECNGKIIFYRPIQLT